MEHLLTEMPSKKAILARTSSRGYELGKRKFAPPLATVSVVGKKSTSLSNKSLHAKAMQDPATRKRIAGTIKDLRGVLDQSGSYRPHYAGTQIKSKGQKLDVGVYPPNNFTSRFNRLNP